MRLLLAVLAAGVVVACEAPSQTDATDLAASIQARADSTRCATLRAVDSLSTSRSGFLQEVLDANPTARTPLFEDSRPESYHVRKNDLAEGLSEISRVCGIPLRGAVIMGPVGLFWSYYILTFQRLGPDSVRVNHLLLAHARVVDKATAVMTNAPVDSLFSELRQSSMLVAGIPARTAGTDTSAIALDFSYNLLVLERIGDSVTIRTAALAQFADSAGTRLLARPNAILRRLAHTYPR